MQLEEREDQEAVVVDELALLVDPDLVDGHELGLDPGLAGHEDLVEHGRDGGVARRLVAVAVAQMHMGQPAEPDAVHVAGVVVDVEERTQAGHGHVLQGLHRAGQHDR